jgi:hypothetical protein
VTGNDARDAQESLRCLLVPWRVGGSIGRSIYAVFASGGTGYARDDDAVIIGVMDTEQLAQGAVVAHNEWLKRHHKDC